jgi:hypothetical protein
MSSRKVLAGVGLAVLVAGYFLAGGHRASPGEIAQPDRASPSGAAALDAPQTPGSAGPATFALRPATATNLEVRPLFDRTTRLAAGKPAKLRFSARTRATGSPASSADVSVSVLRPGHPEERLAAHEVEEGVYEASFTPGGPGQYRMVINAGGVPVASAPPVKVAVVGAVGADQPGVTGVTDISNSTDFDPLTTRSKGTGRGRRR